MGKTWYFKCMGDTVGPLTEAELRERAEQGQITADTYITTEGSDQWTTADRVRGLIRGAEPSQVAVDDTPRERPSQGRQTGQRDTNESDSWLEEFGVDDVAELTRNTPTRKTCPFCMEEIAVAALKCKHCREYLDPRMRQARPRRTAKPTGPPANPGLAAVLSFFVPGLGQVYNGQIGYGLILLPLTLLAYLFLILPGLIVHVISICEAYSYAKNGDG